MIKLKDEMGHHQNYFTGQELCRIIQLRDDKGKLLGRTKFYKKLKADNYMLQNGLLPQFFLDLDLGITYTTIKKHHKYILPLWSEKGLNFLKIKYHVPLSLPNEASILPRKESVSKVLKSINDGELLEVMSDDQYENYLIDKYGYKSSAYQQLHNDGETNNVENDKV